MNSDALAAQALAVVEETKGLRVDVVALREAYEEHSERLSQTERRSRVNRLGLVLTALLLFAVGMLALQNQNTADRLEKVIQGALCPTYDLSIGAYDPSTRPPDAESQRRYREAIDQMRGYREVFECAGELVPARVPGS